MVNYSLFEFVTYDEDGRRSWPTVSFGMPGREAWETVERHIQPGTWSDRVLGNGNIESSFVAWFKRGFTPGTGLDQLTVFFVDAAEKAALPTARERHVAVQGMVGYKNNRQARIVGGSITPIDNTVISRFQDRGGLWTITFERLPYWEEVDGTISVSGYNSYNPLIIGGASETLEELYTPAMGRINRTSIQLRSYTEQFDVKRLWLGIFEIHGKGGYTFNPDVYMDSGVKMYTSDGVGYVATATASGWTKAQSPRITYYPPASPNSSTLLDKSGWADRFACPVRGWRSDLLANDDDTINERRSYVGRYRLLMRYISQQPEDDLDNKQAQTLVRAFSRWSTSADKVSTGHVKSFWHNSDKFRWVDFGEINVGGEAWGLEANQAIDPASWQFGIEAKCAGIPSSNQNAYGFTVDKFVLMPADKMVYLEMPGKNAPPRSTIEILKDDNDTMTAYFVPETPGQGITKIAHVEDTGWAAPRHPNSRLVLVLEHGDAYPVALGITAPVRMWVTPRSAYDW